MSSRECSDFEPAVINTMLHAAENGFKRCTLPKCFSKGSFHDLCALSFHSIRFRPSSDGGTDSSAPRGRTPTRRAGSCGRTKPVFLGAVKKVGAWSSCPVVGLRRGRRRERNIMVEIQKFCKMLSRVSGHGKSFGFAVSHPFCRKERHHGRTASSFEAGGVQG